MRKVTQTWQWGLQDWPDQESRGRAGDISPRAGCEGRPEESLKSCLSWLFPTLAGHQGMCTYRLIHVSTPLLHLVPVPFPGSAPAQGKTFDCPAVNVGRTLLLLLQGWAGKVQKLFPWPSQGHCYTGQAKLDPLYFVRAGRTWKSTW